MKQIDFFYFFGSGYAYLSVMRIDAMAKQSGVAVRWRPFNVRTVMAENNIALRTQAAKVKYMWRDVERRAATHGVPYVRAPIWPTDPDLLANRVAMVRPKRAGARPTPSQASGRGTWKAWNWVAAPICSMCWLPSVRMSTT